VRAAFAAGLCAFVIALTAGCSRDRPQKDDGAPGAKAGPAALTDSAAAIWQVREFRRLVAGEWTEIARGFMAENPRRWYEERSGAGEAWDIAPGAGRWSAWDREFRSQSEEIHWTGDTRVVTIRVREINDYDRLLERPPGETEIVYFLDARGRIEGSLVRGVGVRAPGRAGEFLAWAERESPQELAYLRPGGEIDPTGDRPQRHRALLVRWRAAAGLPALD